MKRLIALHDLIFAPLTRHASGLLPLAARIVVAGVLLVYFWTSAVTKLGPGVAGVFHPSVGAYAQIFPRAMAAVGYDASQLGVFHWAVVVAGTLAEFALPALVVAGLLTRLASLGLIGFVAVQSVTDILGHMADAGTVGRWFDAASGAVILDQRALWVAVLLIPVAMGGGWLSLDRLLVRHSGSA